MGRLLSKAGARARLPCPENKGRPSTTPPDRWLGVLEQEALSGKYDETVLEDVAALLGSVAEKRRLTIDWRGGMMTNAQLIKATAKRVGLAPPELQSDKTPEKS